MQIDFYMVIVNGANQTTSLESRYGKWKVETGETGVEERSYFMAKSPKVEKSLSDKIKAKLMTFHLPLILVFAILIGIVFPAPGTFRYRQSIIFYRSCIVVHPIYSAMCVYDLHYFGIKTGHQCSQGSSEILGGMNWNLISDF